MALILAALAAGLLTLGHGGSARAATGASEASAARLALTREVAYLAAAQNSDGGFGGARGQSSFGDLLGLGLDRPGGGRPQSAGATPRRAYGHRRDTPRSCEPARCR